MQINQYEQNGILVVELSGAIMGGPDATTINELLHTLLEEGKVKIVADLSGVERMNSSGLGILISGLTTMRNAGGDLKLASVTERITSLLKITKLFNVFDIYPSVEKAIKAFDKEE